MTSETFNRQVNEMPRYDLENILLECDIAEPQGKTDEELREMVRTAFSPDQIAELPEDEYLADFSI